MSITAVVLAGGRGTRISHLYPECPKPLIPAAGQPFLYWVTRWLVGQGVGNIVYSTGYRADQIGHWVAGLNGQTDLRLDCRAEAVPLGTAGAVRHCLDLCAPTVLVVNGDSLVLTAIAPAVQRLHAEGLDGVILGARVADAQRYGSLDVSPGGLLSGFREKVPGQGLVNCGVYLFPRAVLAELVEGQAQSLETDFIPDAVRRGRRFGVVDAFPAGQRPAFLDIGTPETVGQADDFIEAYPSAFPPFHRVPPG